MGLQEKKMSYCQGRDLQGSLGSKNYTQVKGVGYEETFSLDVMLKYISILLNIDVHHDYYIWQMDVKTTFLKRTI